MAKKVKKTGLNREDLWKFVPKKSVLPITVGIKFDHKGLMFGTNLTSYMGVNSNTQVNMPVVVAAHALAPLVKQKDWPSEITVEKYRVEQRGQMVDMLRAEVVTENGLSFRWTDTDLFPAEDFPKEIDRKFHFGADIDAELARQIKHCGQFAELAKDNSSEALHSINVEDGYVVGATIYSAAAYLNSLPDMRIGTDVSQFCMEGGKLEYCHDGSRLCSRITYADGSWVGTGISDNQYPKVLSLMKTENKVWATVTARVSEWRRVLSAMLVYHKKERGLKFEITGESVTDKRATASMFEWTGDERNRDFQPFAGSPTITLNCGAAKNLQSEGYNSFTVNPKMLKLHLDQLPDNSEMTIQYFGVNGHKGTMDHLVRTMKPMFISCDQDLAKRLLMPIADPRERVHTGYLAD